MRHWLKILCFMFLLISISAEARVLDIIVGGSNAGLECKTDAECGPDKYCNQEQYYCTACKVPPKVWTGTECKCPAGLVDKSDTECVQCLTDDNCAAKGDEMFCNTDSNTCIQCKEPKEWKDNVCACPAKTHEVGDDCICDNPNTNLDEFNFCACTLTPASCATTELNLTECMCCPIERPVTIGNECKTCASVNPSKPVWDSAKKECVECLKDSQCTGARICADKQCVCKGVQVWNGTKCVCPSNTPSNADPVTCDCLAGMDLVKGKCVVECPMSALGMTGARDKEGRCLCNMGAGYVQLSVDNTWCNCDEKKNSFNKPDGTCMTCERTTVEWAKRFNYPRLDVNSMDDSVWYCGYMKWDASYGEKWYNPSTKSYCAYRQVLKKDGSGGFYCTTCGEHFETGNINARTTQFGFCGCLTDGKWQWKDGGMRCVTPCPSNKVFKYGSVCSACSTDQWSFNGGQTCGGPACNNVPAFQEGSIVFNMDNWKKRTPTYCHNEGGFPYYSNDPNNACYFVKGCILVQSALPSCSFGIKITSACTCSTGGNVGEYCCAAAQVKTASGCVTCTGSMVPNTNRTACVACADNQVPSSDKKSCVRCQTGQVPNFTRTKCVPCAAGMVPDKTGRVCVRAEINL